MPHFEVTKNWIGPVVNNEIDSKGVVQEVKKFEVSDATKNAIKNLSQYGVVAEDFEVKDSNQAMLISIANNMVKAIKGGKL
ncbi:hypothetical protein [Metabacillus fastidiosus]|uniref:hypothetical protein n=1 Tax=Metabacillus fastidiosus TaxID=1458 RepID=UPI0008249B20|nr:hypothetical protein [Metabacillus fastidiosus]MED4462666.1 hypothetical protein [Metabacillus fastidiosus]